MRGRVVSGGREAVIAITLLGGSANGAVEVEAVIDTGFTGHLTLPPAVIRSLALPKRGFVEVELADGGAASRSMKPEAVL